VNLKEELIKIAGKKAVLDDPTAMAPYSVRRSLWTTQLPNVVVSVKNMDQAQEVVQLANEKKIPLKPSSSGIHFRETGPNCGGILLDLSKMKKISKIDNRNRKVTVEAGVTWGELTEELKKQRMRTIMPLLPHAHSSVLVSCLERDPLAIPMFEYGELILSMQMIWPTGELFRTGSAATIDFGKKGNFAEGCYPYGPGPIDAMRLMQGAQGTMGTAIWANVKTERLPEVNKSYFIPFEQSEDAVQAMYAIQRRRIGHECFAINNINLAALLAGDMSKGFAKLHKQLPPWSVLMVLSGAKYFPEEKIAYEKEALIEVRNSVFPFTEILELIPGFGPTKSLPERLRNPWPADQTYWKDRYKGACQDLFFITTMEKVPVFVDIVQQIAADLGHHPKEIGMYIQPIEYGAGAHVEFNLFYDPDNAEEMETVTHVYTESIKEALRLEAHFTRPYGKLTSDLVYEKAASYVMLARKTKEIFDPNNIMNPGILCF
jgi:FAD/FMN-containing dehydrogenase